MPYRPIRPRLLTAPQKALKQQMDDLYELAVAALSNPYYQKKQGSGVPKAEADAYAVAKKHLWDDEVAARIAAGLYEKYDELSSLLAVKAALEVNLISVNQRIAELQA